jgi:hypothetical protein
MKPKILDPRITNDRFVLFVPSTETGFNEVEVTSYLKTLKAEEVSLVSESS